MSTNLCSELLSRTRPWFGQTLGDPVSPANSGVAGPLQQAWTGTELTSTKTHRSEVLYIFLKPLCSALLLLCSVVCFLVVRLLFGAHLHASILWKMFCVQLSLFFCSALLPRWSAMCWSVVFRQSFAEVAVRACLAPLDWSTLGTSKAGAMHEQAVGTEQTLLGSEDGQDLEQVKQGKN